MNAWIDEITRTWERATRDLEYGPWRVIGRTVVDATGKPIVQMADRAMAELIAKLPELCDADLRNVPLPEGSPKVVGVTSYQEASDQGYEKGMQQGYENACAEME